MSAGAAKSDSGGDSVPVTEQRAPPEGPRDVDHVCVWESQYLSAPESYLEHFRAGRRVVVLRDDGRTSMVFGDPPLEAEVEPGA